MQTVVKMIFGSQVYGTSTPESDTDYKEVIIPDAKDILLQRVKGCTQECTKADVHAKNTKDDVDIERFTLDKYIALLMEGQTVAVDMLFVPDKHLVDTSRVWRVLQANKDKLLQKKCTAFVGYCLTQAGRYGLRGGRVAAIRGILELLKTKSPWSKIGEHEDIINFCNTTEHCSIIPKKDPTSTSQNDLINVCNSKLSFKDTIKRALELYERKFLEYGERSKQAERNENLDWKALSHSVRILQQAEEVLLTGHITFPRPNAEYLLKIRTGQMPYKEVAEIIEGGIINLQENIMPKCTLRDEPDREWTDNLIYDAYELAVLKEYQG